MNESMDLWSPQQEPQYMNFLLTGFTNVSRYESTRSRSGPTCGTDGLGHNKNLRIRESIRTQCGRALEASEINMKKALTYWVRPSGLVMLMMLLQYFAD